MSAPLPLILEPKELEQHLNDTNLVVVDLSKKDNYDKYHIPGAIYLDFTEIVRVEKPVMGLVPDITELNRVLSKAGINEKVQIVAYDDEGGGKAARLLWTLDLLNHPAASLLNGGIFSWANEGHPISQELTSPTPSDSSYKFSTRSLTSQQFILEHMNDDNIVLLDSRSPEEFAGIKVFANHGGHIPGAVNLDWMLTMDQSNNLRLLDDKKLKELLESRGISKDKQVIVYCQTHHRSSHTYIILKHLGYTNIKGYPGAWSDWGNSESTPKEM